MDLALATTSHAVWAEAIRPQTTSGLQTRASSAVSSFLFLHFHLITAHSLCVFFVVYVNRNLMEEIDTGWYPVFLSSEGHHPPTCGLFRLGMVFGGSK